MAKIRDRIPDGGGTPEVIELLCGNQKLMDRFGVQYSTEQYQQRIRGLESEGLAVIQVSVRRIVVLLLGLEEKRSTSRKRRARKLSTHLRRSATRS